MKKVEVRCGRSDRQTLASQPELNTRALILAVGLLADEVRCDVLSLDSNSHSYSVAQISKLKIGKLELCLELMTSQSIDQVRESMTERSELSSKSALVRGLFAKNRRKLEDLFFFIISSVAGDAR